jgi:integrase/recombinase XerD
MTVDSFQSRLGSYLHAFIRQKQAAGYPYKSSIRILHRFDRLVAKEFPKETTITKGMSESWIHLKPEEHPNGLLRRITPVRQFAKYLNGMGHNVYVIPEHIPNKQIKYEAHIYTDEELKAFFHAVDHCPISSFSPIRQYVAPVLFRLLYCCGLRSSEARLLQCEDVNLTSGKIMIRESKGWKARVVYTSRDLLEVCREYDSIMESMLPRRQVFLPSKDGGFLDTSTIGYWFHTFWDKLPQASEIVGNSARVHDFRHGYAVHRLNQWVKEGENIQALYPYLSAYMGHSSFVYTDYYLSLVEDIYPEMEKRLSSVNNDILPEVHHEEE